MSETDTTDNGALRELVEEWRSDAHLYTEEANHADDMAVAVPKSSRADALKRAAGQLEAAIDADGGL